MDLPFTASAGIPNQLPRAPTISSMDKVDLPFILSLIKVEEQEILALYLHGSHLFGTANEDSGFSDLCLLFLI